MGIRPNPEGLGAAEFARMSQEQDKKDYQRAEQFVNMLIPREWMDSTLIHELGKLAGINRMYLNEALSDATKTGRGAEYSVTGEIRATDKSDVSDEQEEFIRQMKGLLRVREEADEFIAHELNRQLASEPLNKAS